MKKKVALYFGSYNPIHVGHLMVAEYIVENTDVDQLWFVISPSSPFKKHDRLLQASQRYYMVQVAIEDDPRFKACDVEFKLPYPSYTAVTLEKLSAKYPDYQFVIVMGADNLENFERWKNYEYILEHYQLYVYPRIGAKPTPLENHPSVVMISAPQIEISASMIRNSIREKRGVTYFLPPKVKDYIEKMDLYRK